MRNAASELAHSTTEWNPAFVSGTIENTLSATTVVKVFVDRKGPAVGCVTGITKYLTFEFDSGLPNTLTARIADGMPRNSIEFIMLSEKEAREEADRAVQLSLLLDRE